MTDTRYGGMTERRVPVKKPAVLLSETHEARIVRIEKKIHELETAFIVLRDEVTRATRTLADLGTDLLLIRRRIDSGKTPPRYHSFDVDSDPDGV